jgi:archaellum component FlaC
MLYAMLCLVGVFMVKYYTAVEIRKLERRLERVKDDLGQVKDKLGSVQKHMDQVRSDEEDYQDRVRRIKETIEDLEIRMTSFSQDDSEENVVVSDSSSPRPF